MNSKRLNRVKDALNGAGLPDVPGVKVQFPSGLASHVKIKAVVDEKAYGHSFMEFWRELQEAVAGEADLRFVRSFCNSESREIAATLEVSGI